MIATNHALTGAIIGLTVAGPIALPLAFVSHFVLDSIPHYGDNDKRLKNTSFIMQLLIDAVLCGLLVILLALTGAANWPLAVACAFLAASPDFMWLPRFLRARRGQKEPRKKNWIIAFHSWVQWFQRPIGAVVEVVWLVSAVSILVIYLWLW